MIKDTQEYLQHWEKENNPFYPSEMRWDRLQVNRFLKDYKKQLTLTDVGISLPDLAECNQASLDYATKKNNPDFFLIKQTFKDGVNWALNYVTRPK